MTTTTGYQALLVVAAGIATVGMAASAAGIADHICAAALNAAGLGCIAVTALRRERRIRARPADPRTRPAPRPDGAAPHTRVASGDHAPAPPAPATTPTDPSAAAAGRSRTPTGGAP